MLRLLKDEEIKFYADEFYKFLMAFAKTGFLQKKLHKSELFNWTISKNPTVDKNWDGRYIKRTPSDGKWLSKERIYELILEKLTKEEIDHIYESDFTPNKSLLPFISSCFPQTIKSPSILLHALPEPSRAKNDVF